MNRCILIVMDGCGAGEAPDAEAFGDFDHPSTIRHVWEATGGIQAPTLAGVGFFEACGIATGEGIGSRIGCQWGRLQEMSQGGKDSVTGHWEMAGIVLDRRFPTYPCGFPEDVISQFEAEIGVRTIGNRPASGTQIIQELGDQHLATGFPIVYTSADSVFQIAAHENIIPLERLYDYCRTARKLLTSPNDVQRVIARPFTGGMGVGFSRTENRRDFPLPPPTNLCDEIGDVYGIGVVPELFTGRGFRETVRTQSNAQHASAVVAAMATDARFIWANFEDFDMLFGHRNDAAGFAKCLESFDATLNQLIDSLETDDLLILTADHGNDPTTASTDHSRELVPLVVVGPSVQTQPIAGSHGMSTIAEIVAGHLRIVPRW